MPVIHSASVPRLPLEDASLTLASVTELVKDMQKEHETQLAKERQLVVQQVLHSLETKGLLKKAGGDDDDRRARRKATKQSILDKRLRSLLNHSLSESGLQYPHVVPESSRPTTSDVKPQVRPLVLERQEETDQPMAARQVHEKRRQRKRDNAVRRLRENPLHEEEDTASSPPPKSRATVRADEDDGGVVEPILMSSKRSSKMDKKTWVILEQSKKLLQAAKEKGYKPGEVAPKPHLSALMMHDSERQSQAKDALEEITDTAPNEVRDELESAVAFAQSGEDGAEANDCNNQPNSNNESYQLSLLEPFPTSYNTENSDKAWENELARQILSLYATSMTSKKQQKQKRQQQSQQASASSSTHTGDDLEPPSPTKSDAGITRRRRQTNRLPSLDPDRKKRIQHIQDSWQPSHLENGKVVLCLPKIPKPIWFAGTGIVMATWCVLAMPSTEAKLANHPDPFSEGALCKHKLCNELRKLEHNFEFEQYLAVVEALMMSRVRAKRGAPVDDLDLKLWKQLVITANAFASRAIDFKKYPMALALVKKTEAILDDSSLLVGPVRTELLAYISDTYAYYYYSRDKASAGITYISKAHVVHAKHSEWSHLAKCKLHMATLLSKLQQHHEAVLQLELILALVEEAKLEEGGGGASAQKLCMVAVCYNNLALEQLHLKDVDGAATSCQNARRLARLCLSYSNRWLSQFEQTNKAVIRAMATIMGDQGELDMEMVMKFDIEA
ncbi:Aste57867_19960 [Aphanomyces stellatus]|uniref:Aste57867_19960 protein n=1 Tax=Aphanomyces stellatus TaxID=120398 RepID=A0A485LEF6_9STRA|nr:hypothetical protein As57867_019894 [Aphanomyces stellatus]VFT96657.1 Aste57867_19960 [Aphanomyces stellatus]